MTDEQKLREAFERWADDYGLRHEPNYSAHTEADCWAAWKGALSHASATAEECSVDDHAVHVQVECRRCDVCDHIGINDSSMTHGACHDCDWQGPEQIEDKCPGCGNHSCMAAACPECGGRYVLLTDRRLRVTIDQAIAAKRGEK